MSITHILRKIKTKLAIYYYWLKYREKVKKYITNFWTCRVLLRLNQLLIFDEKKGILVRCGLNKLGNRSISNNFNVLKNQLSSNFPTGIFLTENKDVILAGETILCGNAIRVETIDDYFIEKTITLLNDSLYKQNKRLIEFDYRKEMDKLDFVFPEYPFTWISEVKKIKDAIKNRISKTGGFAENNVMNTLIHGDLTFRNMLISCNEPEIYDFCRSEISFPEFDVYLFAIDKDVHMGRIVNFQILFKKIIHFIKNSGHIPEIEIFYRIVPDYQVNQKIEGVLKYLFLYRMVVLSLECFYVFKKNSSIPLEILTSIKGEL